MAQSECDAKEARKFELAKKRVDKALRNLEEAVVGVSRAFNPVIQQTPECAKTQGGTVKSAPMSDFEHMVEAVCNSAHTAADQLREMCSKSAV